MLWNSFGGGGAFVKKGGSHVLGGERKVQTLKGRTVFLHLEY